ncbi:MAG: DNA alkylation repair protein [Bacteroidota bacterium]
MTKNEVLQELELLGTAQTKKIYQRHGAREPFFGVKVGNLKKIQKKIKKDHPLALALYESENSDAMYLAGLIADPSQMTMKDLDRWVKKAYWYMLSEYTVAWVAAESKIGYKAAIKWIDAKEEMIAAAGWATLSSILAIRDDATLEVPTLQKLLTKVEKEIHQAQNRVRYTMNGFIIAVGSYVAALTQEALQVAQKVGTVKVDMGETSCKVPLASAYIKKVQIRGGIGKKKRQARC